MLSLVPTPIGNLEDITQRAIRILGQCTMVIAEDTRKSGLLLQHLGIQKKIQSFHTANEHKVLDGLIEKLLSGEHLALVTDAGTPGISDPGFLLVRACIKNDIEVECLPGATAFVPALVVSGLPCERFCFEGFLPPKKGRSTRLLELSEETRTMVFYESPHRIQKTIAEFCETFGSDRPASFSREISKKFEENKRGTLSELKQHLEQNETRGEFVIVVQGIEKKKKDVKEKKRWTDQQEQE
jgi:16S rRNA (cytidine1402-2'-O)-methyltransferase